MLFGKTCPIVAGGFGNFGKSMACLISGNKSINSICSSRAVITSSSSGIGRLISFLPTSVKKTLLTSPSQLEAIIDPVYSPCSVIGTILKTCASAVSVSNVK